MQNRSTGNLLANNGSLHLFSVTLATFLISACSSIPTGIIGNKVDSHYSLPATYQEHREQQQFFATKDGQIAYTDHGNKSAPVIVLLHGVPTSSWMFRKVIPGLQQSLRVITVDHMGYGSSDKPGGNVYTTEQQANRVLSLLAHLDIAQYGILMHDMGGLVAWEMLQTNRDNISHLVVLNTIVHQQGFNHPTMNPGMMTRTMTKAFSSNLTSTLALKKTFDDLGLDGEFKLTEEECFGYVGPMREGSDKALYSFYTSINSELFEQLDDNRVNFKKFRGKALVMWGAQDSTLTIAQIPILRESLSIPSDNIHIYEENAHFLAEEIPEEIVIKVSAFMKDHMVGN